MNLPRQPRPRRFNAAFALVLALNVLVFSSFTAARIVFALFALDLGASPSDVGGITAALYLFPLLLSWPIGVLADRHRPGILLVGGTAAGACGTTLPFLMLGIASLYVAANFLGVSLVFTTVMSQSLAGSMSLPEHRTRNFSNYAITGSVAIFVGPLLAGRCIDNVGFGATCIGISLALLLAVVLLLWGKTLPRNQLPEASKGSLLHTLADRRVWTMLAVSSLAQLGSDIFMTFLPIHAHSIGVSATDIGVILSFLAAGSFVVRIGMGRLIAWIGESRLLATAFYVGAAMYVLLPMAARPISLGLLALLFGMCQGCTQPLTMMMMFNTAEQGRAGEAIGLRMTINNASRMISPALFGGVASLASLLVVFWINGMLMATGGRMSRADPEKPWKGDR